MALAGPGLHGILASVPSDGSFLGGDLVVDYRKVCVWYLGGL